MKKKIVLALFVGMAMGLLYAATGDETASLSFLVKPQAEYSVWSATVTGSWDADDTGNVTQAITVNGVLLKVVFSTPDATNTVTYQVQIRDNEDVIIFDSGEQSENADYTFDLYEPLTGTIDVIIGPSGAMGATNPDATVTLRGI